MTKYKFGLNAETHPHSVGESDFSSNVNVAGAQQNQNPLGTSYFNDPTQVQMTPDNAKVTSIPSPYARMHITDIAFRELMTGHGVLDGTNRNQYMNNMSGDYLRAMSRHL